MFTAALPPPQPIIRLFTTFIVAFVTSICAMPPHCASSSLRVSKRDRSFSTARSVRYLKSESSDKFGSPRCFSPSCVPSRYQFPESARFRLPALPSHMYLATLSSASTPRDSVAIPTAVTILFIRHSFHCGMFSLYIVSFAPRHAVSPVSMIAGSYRFPRRP